MEKPPIRINLFTDTSQLVDMTGRVDTMLSGICEATGRDPFDVLTAALVLLKMRDVK